MRVAPREVCGLAEVVFVEIGEAEHLGEGIGANGGLQAAGGGELGVEMIEPGDDQGDDKIAAIARVNGFMIATRNTADFDDCGVDLVNPFAMRAR